MELYTNRFRNTFTCISWLLFYLWTVANFHEIDGGTAGPMSLQEMIEISVRKSLIQLEKDKKILYDVQCKELLTRERSGISGHQLIKKIRDPIKGALLNDKAYIVAHATKAFQKLSGYPLVVIKNKPELIGLWRTIIRPYCDNSAPICYPDFPYRTADGSCNNLLNPTWGAADTPNSRWLPPEYLDGLTTPRTFGKSGVPLPNVRDISNALFDEKQCKSTHSPFFTMMYMTWGQFLSHDISFTPEQIGKQNASIMCCKNGKPLLNSGPCFPIRIPENDPHLSCSCMNFVRSSAAPNQFCDPDWLDQVNGQSSYIDASHIYGTTKEIMDDLRSSYGGLMKTSADDFLPKGSGQNSCILEKLDDYCFKAGDDRHTMVPSVTYLHILFLREHNRIARKLGLINPHWSSDKIFQETRKIIAAFMQHFTYTEYLPILLNTDFSANYGLHLNIAQHNVYDNRVDATTSNVFNVAAFRFGHSEITNTLMLANKYREPTLRVPIEHTFRNPTLILSDKRSGYDSIGRWLIDGKKAKIDRCFADGIRNKLFQARDGQSSDLPAMTVQRGREHGIPSYNEWRKFCGFQPVLHFGIGPGGMQDFDVKEATTLSQLYRHPDDMDLFAAGISERRIHGGLIGPTFACILSKQFGTLKTGDRFWYENQFPNTGFTPGQLEQIRKVRLSSIMCANTKMIESQLLVYKVPCKSNPIVPCSKLPALDLRFWKENIKSKY